MVKRRRFETEVEKLVLSFARELERDLRGGASAFDAIYEAARLCGLGQVEDARDVRFRPVEFPFAQRVRERRRTVYESDSVKVVHTRIEAFHGKEVVNRAEYYAIYARAPSQEQFHLVGRVWVQRPM